MLCSVALVLGTEFVVHTFYLIKSPDLMLEPHLRPKTCPCTHLTSRSTQLNSPVSLSTNLAAITSKTVVLMGKGNWQMGVGC